MSEITSCVVYGFQSDMYYEKYLGEIYATNNISGPIIYGILPIFDKSIDSILKTISKFENAFQHEMQQIEQFALEKGLECTWQHCLCGEIAVYGIKREECAQDEYEECVDEEYEEEYEEECVDKN